ncbi:6181_t:CDS:1, partial [Dentiscutata heterogama]
DKVHSDSLKSKIEFLKVEAYQRSGRAIIIARSNDFSVDCLRLSLFEDEVEITELE